MNVLCNHNAGLASGSRDQFRCSFGDLGVHFGLKSVPVQRLLPAPPPDEEVLAHPFEVE
eukprot:CAMPEP_0203888042 /NCGR_PEP_ID=MMETSP0359-20131031/31691_1 /ASSEMBLY_ACC=CAM_ASM_000338 /TAXON_ID=268821 /ORGANISM="Scrippsiella Hangoei, Strain SHTV-5" /LENGTH=58 /DNA_ID=CAMNT_0050809165 /DNA_START=17 /DNA_END=190 /DNA_ORIENTATION=+